MTRAPSIRPERANGTRRTATIHFPAATSHDNRHGIYYSTLNVGVSAHRDCYERPHVRLTGSDASASRDVFFHLECDELTALGALAEITLEIEPEIDGPEDHFSNDELVECPEDCPLGDEKGMVRCDALDVWNIRQGIERGNEWAWCSVTVTARWLGHEGSDHLGGCFYGSEAEFRRPGGYFDDMVCEALRNLRDAIEASAK